MLRCPVKTVAIKGYLELNAASRRNWLCAFGKPFRASAGFLWLHSIIPQSPAAYNALSHQKTDISHHFTKGHKKRKTAMRSFLFQLLVGVEGFEPPGDGVRVRCLTAWRHPSFSVVPSSSLLTTYLLYHTFPDLSSVFSKKIYFFQNHKKSPESCQKQRSGDCDAVSADQTGTLDTFREVLLQEDIHDEQRQNCQEAAGFHPEDLLTR